MRPSPLIPWVGGRAELLESQHPEHARFDPFVRSAAPFFDLVRRLDRIGWAEPLGRVRPSWVFYDCALVPGLAFGYALPSNDLPESLREGLAPGYQGLVPVSLFSLIPTIGGADLVQSLAALELPTGSADALATETLRAGVRALGVSRLCAAIPWSSPFLHRFCALGALRLSTAWTPAHDEPRTATFTVTPGAILPASNDDVAFAPSDDALQALHADIERGAVVDIRAFDALGRPLLRFGARA